MDRDAKTGSNVNHTEPGLSPDEAAVVIGGKEIGGSAQSKLCGFVLLGDHEFAIV